MGQVVLACPIAMLVHAAQKYDCAVAQCGQTPDLRVIQRMLTRVRPSRKNRRQKKNVSARAVRLLDFPGIMDRRAEQQPTHIRPPP